MRFQQTASLDFPATDATLGTTVIDVTGPISVLAIAWAGGGAPATDGTVVVSILKDGGAPATQADYHELTRLSAPGIVNLAGLGINRVRVQGRSGTGTGTVAATVAAS